MRIDVKSDITGEVKKIALFVSDDFSLKIGDILTLDNSKYPVTIEKIYTDIPSNIINNDCFLKRANILEVNGENYSKYLLRLNNHYRNQLIKREKCIKKLKKLKEKKEGKGKLKLKITHEDLKGDIENFPIEVVKKMCKNQIKQGNPFNVKIFQNNKADGFKWDNTKEGRIFWLTVIRYNDFDRFFEKYPKNKKIEN